MESDHGINVQTIFQTSLNAIISNINVVVHLIRGSIYLEHWTLLDIILCVSLEQILLNVSAYSYNYTHNHGDITLGMPTTTLPDLVRARLDL